MQTRSHAILSDVEIRLELAMDMLGKGFALETPDKFMEQLNTLHDLVTAHGKYPTAQPDLLDIEEARAELRRLREKLTIYEQGGAGDERAELARQAAGGGVVLRGDDRDGGDEAAAAADDQSLPKSSGTPEGKRKSGSG